MDWRYVPEFKLAQPRLDRTPMTSGIFNPRSMQSPLRRAPLAIAGFLAVLAVAGDHAVARSSRSESALESVERRAAGEPIIAVVSLKKQRITVYDASGWILRALVSSGQRGRETPAGIFSIIQKEAEHYSNLYDDAYMPHLQRLTWSGIALHGGYLPGYPASHGCIRMPFDFAARLFDATRLGLRVIVAPTDVAPTEIAHPLLSHLKPLAGGTAEERISEADEASKKAGQARLAAGAAFRDAMQATVPVRTAENLKYRTEEQLAAAETALNAATSPETRNQAEESKAKAAARIDELQLQWAAAKAELQPKLDALKAAREAALAAENARAAAADAAREATRELEPVSILVSRKTQRLYVRRAFEPIFDSPITISDPDLPIGTHVFTAVAEVSGDANIRWNVVSLEGSGLGAVEPHGRTQVANDRTVDPALSQASSANAALDRITIPQDVLDRIPGLTLRSSLIVTDEALSAETGKGTDFVVLLSGEPQGGIKFRRRGSGAEIGYVRPRDRLPYWRSPFTPFSTW